MGRASTSVVPAVVVVLCWNPTAYAQQPGLGSVTPSQRVVLAPPTVPQSPGVYPVPTVTPSPAWSGYPYPPFYYPPVVWPSVPPPSQYYVCWGGVWTPVYCAYRSPFSAPPGYLPWYKPWPYPVRRW